MGIQSESQRVDHIPGPLQPIVCQGREARHDSSCHFTPGSTIRLLTAGEDQVAFRYSEKAEYFVLPVVYRNSIFETAPPTDTSPIVWLVNTGDNLP